MDTKTEHKLAPPTAWFPCVRLAAALFPDRNVVEQKHPVGRIHQYLRNRDRTRERASLTSNRRAEAQTSKDSISHSRGRF